jgi:hypothetical protein
MLIMDEIMEAIEWSQAEVEEKIGTEWNVVAQCVDRSESIIHATPNKRRLLLSSFLKLIDIRNISRFQMVQCCENADMT